MARYQPKNTKYNLPKAVYMKTMYSIMEYERMKNDLYGCPNNKNEFDAIERAIKAIPEQAISQKK